MKHKLKYFGIGLLVAGLIFSLGEQFEIPYIESSKNIETYSEEKHYENEIASLNNKTIATLEDELQLLKNKNEELLKSSVNNTTNDEAFDSTTEVVKGTIYIYESVTLYDIGRQVEDLNIIENGRELELFLAKPEYARSIQKGVFELSSDMTLKEMAKVLTGKR